MKNLRILLLVLLGVVLGFAIRTNYELASFDRGERMFDLFQRICLTDPQGSPEALGLVAAEPDEDGSKWRDTATEATVILNGRDCRVGTFDAPNLSQGDVDRWAELATDAASAFPALAFDDKSVKDGDTFARGWMKGSLKSPERWGISVWASRPGSDDGVSILSFRAPLSE